MDENSENQAVDTNIVCDALFTEVFTRIRSRKEKSLNVQAALFELVGTIASCQPKAVESSRLKLEEILIGDLKGQIEGKRKFEAPIAAGCIAGLTGFYMQFLPLPASEKKVFKLITTVLQKESFKEMSRYALQVNALNFLKHHLDKFQSLAVENYQNLCEKFQFYLVQDNSKLSHCAHGAMIAFQQVMANALPGLIAPSNDDNTGKAIFVYLYRNLFATFLDPDSKPKSLALAIEGLGKLSPFCANFLGPSEVVTLFSSLLQKCKQIRISVLNSQNNSNTLQSSRWGDMNNLYYFPNLVLSLATIISTNEIADLNELVISQLKSLQSICTFLIGIYPLQLPPQQKVSTRAIISLLKSLHQRNIYFEKFVDEFWVQALLRSCQHPSVNVLLQVASESNDEKVLSYKNYIPFLQGVVNSGQQEIYLDDENRLAFMTSLRLSMLSSFMRIVQLLNLRTTKKPQNEETDFLISGTEELVPEKPSDVEIFVNLVAIFEQMVSIFAKSSDGSEKQFLAEFLEFVCRLVEPYFNVSGIYKLLTTLVNTMVPKCDNQIPLPELDDMGSNLVPVALFLKSSISSFSDEILISALFALFAMPVQVYSIIDNQLDVVRKCLKNAFDLNYLPLAKSALEVMQKLVLPSATLFAKKDVSETIQFVAPSLFPYLCFADFAENDNQVLVSIRKIQARSTIQRYFKSSNSKEVDPKEMKTFQEKLFVFLADTNIPIQNLFKELQKSDMDSKLLSVTANSSAKIEFPLPFKDVRPVITFDSIITSVIDSALFSTNRKCKIAACELLHSLCLLIIGKNAQTRSSENLDTFVTIFELLFPAMIRLAADSDSIANQLFGPLSLQAIHWFTSSKYQSSPETLCLIAAIFDQLTSEQNVKVTIFAARCLTEVFEWSIKHCLRDDELMKNTRIKQICKLITYNAKNPKMKAKAGALIAFSACKRVIREHQVIVDTFLIEWILSFLDLLRSLHYVSSSDVNLVEKAKEVIGALVKIYSKYSEMFRQKSKSRRIPFKFQDGTTSELLKHLVEQMNSQEVEYRRIVLTLIGTLVPLAGLSAANFFRTEIGATQLEVRSAHVDDVVDKINGKQFENIDSKAVFEFLFVALGTLDCYTWAVANAKFDLLKLIGSGKYFCSLMHYFVTFMVEDKGFSLYREKLTRENYPSKSKIDCVSSMLVSGLFRLINLTQEATKGKNANKILGHLVSDNFSQFLCLCVLDPARFISSGLGEFTDLLCETLQIMSLAPEQRIPLESGLSSKFCLSKTNKPEEYLLIAKLRQNSRADTKSLLSVSKSCQLSFRAFPSLYSLEKRRNISKLLVEISFEKIEDLRSSVLEEILQLSCDLHFDPSQFISLVTHGVDSASSGFMSKCNRKMCQIFVNNLMASLEHVIKLCSESATGNEKTILFSFLSSVSDNWFMNREKWTSDGLIRNGNLKCFASNLDKLSEIAKSSKIECFELLMNICRNLLAIDKDSVLNEKSTAHQILNLFKFCLGEVQVQFTAKMESLELLWYLTNIGDEIVDEVSISLKDFLVDDLVIEEGISMADRNSLTLASSMEKFAMVEKSFDRLFHALKITSSSKLLDILVPVVCRTPKFPFLEKFQKALTSIGESMKFRVNETLLLLNKSFELCLKNYNLMPDVRRRVFEQVFKVLIASCAANIFKQFFLDKLKTLIEVLESSTRNSSILSQQASISDSLLDIEIVFNTFNCAIEIFKGTDFTKPESEINGWFKTASGVNQTLMKYLIQVCANCKNETPIRGDIYASDRRSLHASAYTCLANLIMSCTNKVEFFNTFLLDEKATQQRYWLTNLVDISHSFNFSSEVSNQESVKMKRLAIQKRRNHSKHGVQSTDESSYFTQENYLTTQNLLESSFRDEVNQFETSKDPTTNDLEVTSESNSEEPMETEENNDVIELPELEVLEDCVTSNPVFGTIVQIVKHIHKNFVQTILDQSTTQTSQNIPVWVVKFKQQLRGTHINIACFAAKVIIFCKEEFSEFDQVLLPELIQVLEVYLSTTKSITSFVVELVCLLADWLNEIRVKNSLFVLESKAVNDLNRSFAVMCKFCSHPNHQLFKNNLELLKILFESFKTHLLLDYDVIYDKLRGSLAERSPELEAGIQILGLVAAHKLPCFPTISNIEKCSMFADLLKFLNHKSSHIFNPVAETVGLILSYYSRSEEANEKFFFEEINKMTTEKLMEVKQKSNEKRVNNIAKFITIFSHICDRFPEFGKQIVGQAFFLFPSVNGRFKLFCLNVIFHHCLEYENSFVALKDYGILQSLLANVNEKLQMSSLKVVEKMIPALRDPQLLEVVSNLSTRVHECSNVQPRYKICEILIAAHKILRSKDPTVAKGLHKVLLSGLVDSEPSIGLLVLKYVSKQDSLPEGLPEKITSICRDFFDRKFSSQFLKYSTNILFDSCSQSPEYGREIFDTPLDRCEFQQCNIENIWVNRHSGFLPLFIDTQPLTRMSESLAESQLSSLAETTNRSSRSMKMRATVKNSNLNFSATHAVVENSFSWLTESEQILPEGSQSIQVDSSLLADVRAESTALASKKSFQRSRFNESVEMSSGRTSKTPRKSSARERVRLLVLTKRDSSQDKAYFVKKAYDAAKERVKFSSENAMRRQNEVSMFRSYRVGEIPDIQIKHSDVVVPLMALAQNEPEICSFVFVELVRGVISCVTSTRDSRYDKDQSKSLLEQLSNSFNFILSNSVDSSSELLVKSILWIAEKHSSIISLDTRKATLCAVESSLELSAIAYLESKLLFCDAQVESPQPVSKRRKLATNDEGAEDIQASDIQFGLFTLSRSLGDFDHLGDFKFGDCYSTTSSLVRMENCKMHKETVESCESNLKKLESLASNEELELWKNVMSKSLYDLCDWENLSSIFDDQIHLLTDQGSIPWFSGFTKLTVEAKCKLIVEDHDAASEFFMKYLENVTNNTCNRKDFSKQFPTYTSLILLKQGYPFSASDILREHGVPKLESALRNLVSARGSHAAGSSGCNNQFKPVSELLKFLSLNVKNSPKNEEQLKNLMTHVMRSELDLMEEPSSIWEDVRIVRESCLKYLLESFCETSPNIEPERMAKISIFAQNELIGYNMKFAYACVKQSRLQLANKNLDTLEKVCKSSGNILHKLNWELTNNAYLLKLSKFHDNVFIVSKHLKKSIISLTSYLSSSLLTSHENFSEVMTMLARSLLALYNINPSEASTVVSSIKNTRNETLPSGFLLPWNESPNDAIDACLKTLQTACEFPLRKQSDISAQNFHQLGKFCLNVISLFTDAPASQGGNGITQHILESLIDSTCQALKLGKHDTSAFFPRILGILAEDMNENVLGIFRTSVLEVPSWMFLPWVDQIMAHLGDTNTRAHLVPLVKKIATDYPQAMFFPYKISVENNTLLPESVIQDLRRLVTNSVLERILAELQNVALTPSAVTSDFMQECSRNPIGQREQAYIQLHYDLFGVSPDVKNSGEESGSFSEFQKKLSKEYKKDLDKICGDKGTKLKSMDIKALRKGLDDFRRSLSRVEFPKNLEEYSSYLANFSEIHPHSNVEIPGQYSGSSKPMPELHFKIVGFRGNISVMESIRKPRKIAILGSDEKEYPFLLKGGEDLRQDARLMKVFKLMSDVLAQNAETKSSDLSLQIYDVIPMTLKLGLIQWVPNTTTYQCFYESMCSKSKVESAKGAMRDTIMKFLGGKDLVRFFLLWAKGAKNTEAASMIQRSTDKLGKYSFRKAIEQLSAHPDSFIVLRDRFIRSYSTMCLCHYILGIGDRHTSNTLINLKKCTAVGIDFGHAFGTATQFLPVPEIVPFRMTPLVTNLIIPQPSPRQGVIHVTMVKVLQAISEDQESLMNILEIFLREPVLDWIEFAQRQASAMGTVFDTSTQNFSKCGYAQEKLVSVRKKLNGSNPMNLMISELKLNNSVMKDATALKSLGGYVMGSSSSVRNEIVAKITSSNSTSERMSKEDQVSCLLDQATDLNVLGRTWFGWSPFA